MINQTLEIIRPHNNDLLIYTCRQILPIRVGSSIGLELYLFILRLKNGMLNCKLTAEQFLKSFPDILTARVFL